MSILNRLPSRGYGWLKDLPDQRDHFYAVPPALRGAWPAKADLSMQCPPVNDQGQLGSCTTNAIGAAIQFNRLKQKLFAFAPLRLFIYYNERVIEHIVTSDSVTQIHDGIKRVAQLGDCPETEWPCQITKFKSQPAAAGYADALNYKVVSYQRIPQTLRQLIGCLASGWGLKGYSTLLYAYVTGAELASDFWTIRVVQ